MTEERDKMKRRNTRTILWAVFCLTIAAEVGCAGRTAKVAVKPPKEKAKFHLYLLMGQSNMVGRGRIEEPDRRPNPRILVFTKDRRWALARDPLHFDHPLAGVGPGLSFARAMAAEDESVTIGLIPCAVDATALQWWEKGGVLYEYALARARAARKHGVLKGVLWHQGEADSRNRRTAESYAPRLDRMIQALRKELEIGDLPFVAGKLGEFLEKWFPLIAKVNQALAGLPGRVLFTGCADATGLKDNGDGVHFSAPAQREFGQRYAKEMRRLAQARKGEK